MTPTSSRASCQAWRSRPDSLKLLCTDDYWHHYTQLLAMKLGEQISMTRIQIHIPSTCDGDDDEQDSGGRGTGTRITENAVSMLPRDIRGTTFRPHHLPYR
jgi:hypothetical protein